LLLQFYCVINSFQDNQLELIGAITLMWVLEILFY
jgi:hypothetical protein